LAKETLGRRSNEELLQLKYGDEGFGKSELRMPVIPLNAKLGKKKIKKV